MKRPKIRYSPVRFTCVFCACSRLELIDPASEKSGALCFSADIDGDRKPESVEFLTCRCGAEFHWSKSGEGPSGVPEGYAVLPITGVTFNGWRLFAVKEPLLVKTYTLTSNRPAEGRARSWAQRIIRIPSSFKFIQDGAYISHHTKDGLIILKPVEAKAPRKHA